MNKKEKEQLESPEPMVLYFCPYCGQANLKMWLKARRREDVENSCDNCVRTNCSGHLAPKKDDVCSLWQPITVDDGIAIAVPAKTAALMADNDDPDYNYTPEMRDGEQIGVVPVRKEQGKIDAGSAIAVPAKTAALMADDEVERCTSCENLVETYNALYADYEKLKAELIDLHGLHNGTLEINSPGAENPRTGIDNSRKRATSEGR